eukprot:m.266841 g.266841  ORF g.266841 m.266841 type:complete len:503 (+) comp15633_c0_seq3:154-1662(+)
MLKALQLSKLARSGVVQRSPPPLRELLARRNVLASLVPPNTIAVIPSNNNAVQSNDIPFRFRQNSNLWYLTGFNEADSTMILQTDSDGKIQSTAIACTQKDPAREMWDGAVMGEKAAEFCHVDTYIPSRAPTVRAPSDPVVEYIEQIATDESQIAVASEDSCNPSILARIRTAFPTATTSLNRYLDQMRLLKSPFELAQIQHANEITASAIRHLLQSNPQHEYEVDAMLEYLYKLHGTDGHAFPPVVAAGKSALTLHYIDNDKPVQSNQLVLLDTGCRLNYYHSDISRCWPGSGKFSQEQRQVYQAVLNVQNSCIKALQHGCVQNFWGLTQVCNESTVKELCEIGLLPPNATDSLRQHVLPHSIGHFLGLDVHDCHTVPQYQVALDKFPFSWQEQYEQLGMGKLSEAVQRESGRLHSQNEGSDGNCFPSTEADFAQIMPEGAFVLTVEPGCYVSPHKNIPQRFHGIGVRIEDNVAVSPNGTVWNFSHAIPKDVSEVEELMKR